jgi:preprotein translocase subunit Sss1
MRQRRQRQRSQWGIVLSLGVALSTSLVEVPVCAANGWSRAIGTPQLVFGVQAEGLVSAPMLVVSLAGADGSPMDFYLALPEPVAAEVSRHIVRHAFDEHAVEDARMRALAALAALKAEDVQEMLAPLIHHSNLQSYLRNVKFALARVVREASRPTGEEVEAYYRINGSGLRFLTGLRIGKRQFEFTPPEPDARLLSGFFAQGG